MIQARSAPAAAPINCGFRPMAAASLDTVRGWLAGPNVTRWWPDPECALHSIAAPASASAVAYLMLMDGRDVGDAQGLPSPPEPVPCTGREDHATPDRHQPRGTRGIPHSIGEACLLPPGGPHPIRGVLERPFDTAACVATDPDPSSARRAGFRCRGSRDTAWGQVLPTHCHNLIPIISP